ncbi:MAG TPA: prepilin-type N-terminal cleavage/methylation domain-containing protein [Oscillatoriaceae cyanobacterium]
MRKRLGVTLVEVLVAVVVLTISLAAIAGTAGTILQKSSQPALNEQAAMIANDRLDYFRGQTDPFRAAGGTEWAPPKELNMPDDNKTAGLNNNFNAGPVLFVREFLYGDTAGQYKNNLTGNDDGLANQNREATVDVYGANGQPGTDGFADAGRNEIPPTLPNGYNHVFPNVDGTGALPASDPTSSNKPVDAVAPRANDDIVSGSLLPPSIKWAREVWVQTNNPNFKSSGAATPGFNLCITPDVQPALPPYCVAVTVKVYVARNVSDPRAGHRGMMDFRAFNPASLYPSGASQGGLGYDPNRPLATMVGYFGLERMTGN